MNQHQQHPLPGGGQPPNQPKDELATASFVLGILSLIMMGFILGPLAIIFANFAKKNGNTSSKVTAGLVTGIVGLVTWTIIILFVLYLEGVGYFDRGITIRW